MMEPYVPIACFNNDNICHSGAIYPARLLFFNILNAFLPSYYFICKYFWMNFYEKKYF